MPYNPNFNETDEPAMTDNSSGARGSMPYQQPKATYRNRDGTRNNEINK